LASGGSANASRATAAGPLQTPFSERIESIAIQLDLRSL
jgi:hypothetical protein